MSCCGQITSIRVPIELSNQSDVLKVTLTRRNFLENKKYVTP